MRRTSVSAVRPRDERREEEEEEEEATSRVKGRRRRKAASGEIKKGRKRAPVDAKCFFPSNRFRVSIKS